jgi:hypothetical protein
MRDAFVGLGYTGKQDHHTNHPFPTADPKLCLLITTSRGGATALSSPAGACFFTCVLLPVLY